MKIGFEKLKRNFVFFRCPFSASGLAGLLPYPAARFSLFPLPWPIPVGGPAPRCPCPFFPGVSARALARQASRRPVPRRPRPRPSLLRLESPIGGPALSASLSSSCRQLGLSSGVCRRHASTRRYRVPHAIAPYKPEPYAASPPPELVVPHFFISPMGRARSSTLSAASLPSPTRC